MNDDIDYIEYGQWVWQAMNEFDCIKFEDQQVASTINNSRPNRRVGFDGVSRVFSSLFRRGSRSVVRVLIRCNNLITGVSVFFLGGN